jgi:hypothetical protein
MERVENIDRKRDRERDGERGRPCRAESEIDCGSVEAVVPMNCDSNQS